MGADITANYDPHLATFDRRKSHGRQQILAACRLEHLTGLAYTRGHE